MAAAQYVLCQYNIHRSNLDAALAITPGRRAATVSPLEDDGWSAVSAMVKKSEVATVMDRLEEVGGKDIFTLALDVSSSDRKHRAQRVANRRLIESVPRLTLALFTLTELPNMREEKHSVVGFHLSPIDRCTRLSALDP
jgi:ATP phosphoribosyltransferase-like protein